MAEEIVVMDIPTNDSDLQQMDTDLQLMDSLLAVERFIYLGTFNPVYQIKHKLIDTEEVEKHAEMLKNISGKDFVKVIEKCIENYANIPRKDEIWYIYATYFLSNAKFEDKKELKNAFIRLAQTAEDVFYYAKYSKIIQEQLNKKGLPRPARSSITKWYKNQEPGAIMDMWTSNIGYLGLTHRILFTLCHINPTDFNQEDTLVLNLNNCSKILKDKAALESDTPKMKKFLEVCKFKTTGDVKLAKRLIKDKILKLESIPQNYLRKISIWEALLPVLTYRQLLKNCHYLIDKKMLDNVQFSKSYLKYLGNKDAMISENIHPIVFLYVKNELIKQKRYSEAVKQNYYEKEIRSSDIKPNTFLNNKISKIFDHSFDNYSGATFRTFITFTLQTNTKRQSVINKTQVSCYDAALTLALTFFKADKSSVVFSYAPETLKLKPIEWKKNWNFSKASEYCASLLTPKKTTPRLIIPITEALSREDVFDLFLVILPAGTRCNSYYKPELLIQTLNQYRAAKNIKAKFVLVNLRRYKPAMDHITRHDDGILEICGMDENTPKLIDAFALHHFN